ncbi:hypothetical protein AB0G32_03865 [Streptomyces sp. NPDC023723]|uniref:hypothetical protein n=1 Tax=Streptomyces sp. NPDC023723 TaxID=3154323 RepID=UPI0033DA0DA0
MVEGEQGSRQAKGSSALGQLLAEVGALLEQYEPGELEVVPRDARERAEFDAYGQGWRDAAAQYRSLIDLVTAAAVPGSGRTPGQAAVIPFRRRERPDRAGQGMRRERAGGDPGGGRTEKQGTSSGRDDEGTRPGTPAEPGTLPVPAGPDERRPEAEAPEAAGTDAATGPDTAAPAETGTHTTGTHPDEPPVFAPKNPRSRAPTIPRLFRQPRPDRHGGE